MLIKEQRAAIAAAVAAGHRLYYINPHDGTVHQIRMVKEDWLEPGCDIAEPALLFPASHPAATDGVDPEDIVRLVGFFEAAGIMRGTTV